MTQSELTGAVEQLESAASETTDDDASERLSELAAQVTDIADGETKADHGRIARIQAALDELQSSVEDDVAAMVDRARDKLSSYREGLDGV
jgi:molecular chaperone GrpE (heat shock protein)